LAATIRDPKALPGFPVDLRSQLSPVLAEYEFRVSAYYASLIDWADPHDPLRRIVLPDVSELTSDLGFDASDEQANTPVRGLQHKYGPTALLLITDVCAAYCRFCFRKRFTLATDPAHQITVGSGARETSLDITAACEYIAAHPQIDNVLLTGGDPLMVSPARLHGILTALRRIPHVRIIRIGSKVPAFDPDRITPALVDVLAEAGSPGRRVHVITHFNHSREVTPTAIAGLDRMAQAGVVLANQTPLLRGVNDSPDELARLLQAVSDAGAPTMYVFHCRPVRGSEMFHTTVQDGLRTVMAVRPRLNGLAKRFRYVASHATGKIEILGIFDGRILMRYHEARDPDLDGRFLTWPADRELDWPDPTASAPEHR
jgi:KamA family protein